MIPITLSSFTTGTPPIFFSSNNSHNSPRSIFGETVTGSLTIISDIKVFKTEEEINFIKKCIYNKLYKNLNQNFTFKLLYRATRDGDKASTFHKNCDGICPLLLLVKTKKEIRFGGFTETYFESTKEYKGKREIIEKINSLNVLLKKEEDEGKLDYSNYLKLHLYNLLN